MSRQYCFLCASDEGVFLDITAENKQVYHDQIETCSLAKRPTENQLPIKICHKCAYELNQCSTFIQKYKRITSKQRSKSRSNHCSLCFESAKKEYIFDLSKDKKSQKTSLDKLHKVFDTDLEKTQENITSICVSCRYTVDVLYDLKNIAQETATKLHYVNNKEIDFLTFPKIKTSVAKRKTTTTTESSKASYSSHDSDNDSSTMARTRTRHNKLNNNKVTAKSKSNACVKCHSSIKPKDILTIPKTNENICKTCWSNMDVKETEKYVQLTETKSCKVFLKDVLAEEALKKRNVKINETPAGQKKEGSANEDDTTEEDTKEGSAEEGSVKDVSIKEETAVEEVSEDKSKSRKAVKMVMKRNLKRSFRNAKSEDTSSDQGPSKRLRANTRRVNQNSELQEPTQKVKAKLKQKPSKGASGQGSDSDYPATKITKANNKLVTGRKGVKRVALSDAEIESKRDRKKLKSILEGISVTSPTIVVSDDSSANDDLVVPRKKRLRFASPSPVHETTESDTVHEKHKRKSTPQKSKASAETPSKSALTSKSEQQAQASVEKSPKVSSPSKSEQQAPSSVEKSPKVSSPSKSEQQAQSSELDDKESVPECATYSCEECGASYENKLLGLTHKLTHYKQPKLELEKVVAESTVKETSEAGDPADEHDITITVDDDEDEATVGVENLDASDRVSKTDSKAETTEDAVDVSLVMKDTSDDKAEETNAEVEESDAEGSEKPADKSLVEDESKQDSVNKNEGETNRRRSKHSSVKESVPEPAESEPEKEKDVEVSSHAESDDKKEEEQVEEKKKDASVKEGDDEAEAEKEKEKDKDAEEEDVEEAEKDKTVIESEEVEGEELEKKESKVVETEEDAQEEKDKTEKEEEKKEDGDSDSDKTDKSAEGEVEEDEGKEKDEGDKEVEAERKEEEEKDAEAEREKGEEKEEEKEGDKVVNESVSETKSDKDSDVAEEGKDGEKVDENGIEEKSAVEETDKGAADKVETECANEQIATKSVEDCEDDEVQTAKVNKVTEKSETIVLPEETDETSADDKKVTAKTVESDVSKQEKSKKDCSNAVAEVLQEVLDLANAEVQKRQEVPENCEESETLENISREIQNSVDQSPKKPDSTTGNDVE